MVDLITDLQEAAQHKSLSLRNRDLMMRAAETIEKMDAELLALKMQTCCRCEAPLPEPPKEG